MKISIIVPVYQAESTIKKCVDSILEQNFTDFELILVDDGSTDLGGHLCDEYAKQDTRVIVLHKKNGGVASARNLGIENAKGEWCMFVDSDDWLDEPDYLAALYSNSTNTQIVVSGFKYYYNRETADPQSLCQQNKLFTGQDYVDFVSSQLISTNFVVVWAKLFKTEVIKNNHLLFDLKMNVVEDAQFLHSYLAKCDTIAICINIGYAFSINICDHSKYMLNAEQTQYQTAAIMEGLHYLTRLKGIANSDYNDYIRFYFCRLYCKYIFANNLFWKESIDNINIVLKDKYIKELLSSYSIPNLMMCLLPTRLKLLFVHYFVRIVLKHKKYFAKW